MWQKNDTLQDFAESTTIHGLRQIINAPSKLTLTTWIVIMFCSMGGLVFETYYVLSSYLDVPVATNTKIGRLDEFPSIIIPYFFQILSSEIIFEMQNFTQVYYN